MFDERNAKDRRAMAACIRELAKTYNVDVGSTEEGVEIELYLAMARGLNVRIKFNGSKSARWSTPNRWLLSYHFSRSTDECLDDRFPGSINPYHFHKATTGADGFDELIQHLERVFVMTNNGTAFDEKRKQHAIRKNGETCEERQKRHYAFDSLPEVKVAREAWYALQGLDHESEAYKNGVLECRRLDKIAHEAAKAAGLLKPPNPTYDINSGVAPVSERLKEMLSAERSA